RVRRRRVGASAATVTVLSALVLVALVIRSDDSTSLRVQGPSPGIDLREVDWRNVAVPGRSCLRSESIRLHDGTVLLRDDRRGHPKTSDIDGPRYDQLVLDRVEYGDFEGAGEDDAAVLLNCNNNGGTADGALLNSIAIYSGRTGAPRLLGL